MTNPSRLDVNFSAPFIHRLRFTKDVLGSERQTFVDVLEPSDRGPSKVQFWVDGHVASARPMLLNALAELIDQFPGRLCSAGNVQIVPGGEEVKNDIHILERMLKVIHAADLDRRSYVVVIGGGATLDAVGFAAAIAHRGIRLVRLPTTTLSQADSGVGVKNGVNLFGKKNWIGSFAVPWAVINDAALLSTLSDRDYRCGFAEAVKVALVKDAEFFGRIEHRVESIAQRAQTACLPILQQSAELHLAHITTGGDPFESKEARPLDFGHWSAHKLESMTNFEMRHGEAVAIGVAIDSGYSSLAYGLSPPDAHRILGCLSSLGFCLDHPILSEPAPLFDGLEEFRQHLGGRLTLTMLKGIGESFDIHEVDIPTLRVAIDNVRSFAASIAETSMASCSM